jgi:hypothetical protein
MPVKVQAAGEECGDDVDERVVSNSDEDFAAPKAFRADMRRRQHRRLR